MTPDPNARVIGPLWGLLSVLSLAALADCGGGDVVDDTPRPPPQTSCVDYPAWYQCVYGSVPPVAASSHGEVPPRCDLYAAGPVPPPPVSFETDVVPILQRACTSSDCHDDESTVVLPDKTCIFSEPNEEKAAGDLYLGHLCCGGWTPTGCKNPEHRLTADERTHIIRDYLVNVSSGTAPEMPRVTPGDPEKSFLMHKLDGCLDPELLGIECKPLPGTLNKDYPPPCGDPQPRGTESIPFDVEEVEIFRRWIAEGARDN